MEQIAVFVSRQYNSVPSELSIVSAQSKRNSVTIPIATASRPLGYSVGVHFEGFCLLVVVTQGGGVMHGVQAGAALLVRFNAKQYIQAIQTRYSPRRCCKSAHVSIANEV